VANERKLKDPGRAHHFALEIGGVTAAVFSEVAGFQSEVEVKDLYQAQKDGKTVIIKAPGNTKPPDITCKRGMTDDMNLYEWHQQVLEGDMKKARKNGSIVLYDHEDKEIIRYNFMNAWPSKWKSSDVNASNNDFIIEEMTIVCERFERAKK